MLHTEEEGIVAATHKDLIIKEYARKIFEVNVKGTDRDFEKLWREEFHPTERESVTPA
jgi:hypothetical protein